MIFITRPVPDIVQEILTRRLPDTEVQVWPHDRNMTKAELLSLAGKGVRGLLCTLADPIDTEVLESLAPDLSVVSTYAVGFNNIDLDAAKRMNIRVTNTPDVLTDATAEIAVGLMLACARRFISGDVMMRSGAFTGWAPLLHRGWGVFGKTVGIVGAGRIGQRTASAMRHGFGCQILYTSRSPKPEFEQSCNAMHVDLDTLLSVSDFISLHCPLTDETRHLINKDALALMKPSAILVNTARGPVIDEEALVEALKTNQIAGAGLDVFYHEPALTDGLTELENVVLLPHIGSATYETRDAMGRLCANAIADVLTGVDPENCLT